MELTEKLDALVASFEPTEKDAKELADQKIEREGFLAAFPKEDLPNLNLEKYCIGKGDHNNLCWWVERGTSSYSKYSPGSSRSYGIYWNRDEEAYDYSSSAKKYQEQNPAANAETVLQEAIVKPLVRFIEGHGTNAKEMGEKVVGPGFLLKLLILYYPDEFIQINSTAWLDAIIEKFGLEKSDSFVEDNKTVKRFYEEKRKLVEGGDLPQGAFVSMLVHLAGLKNSEKIQYWHMQIHPGNGEAMTRDDALRLINEYGVVGMGGEWENDGGQPEMFKNGVREGDVIGIREGGFVALVRVTGPCRDNERVDDLI